MKHQEAERDRQPPAAGALPRHSVEAAVKHYEAEFDRGLCVPAATHCGKPNRGLCVPAASCCRQVSWSAAPSQICDAFYRQLKALCCQQGADSGVCES